MSDNRRTKRVKKKRKAFKRKVVKTLLLIGVVFGLFLYGIKFYFTQLDPMKPKLNARVKTVEEQYHIHPIQYIAIPKTYRQAVIATEDRRFSWDPGIDPIGIIRSVGVDLVKNQYAQGGSTITQQVVDNTFLERNKSLTYKIKQTIYAIGIYDTFQKQDVFEMYANIIYFGHGAYGLVNASETYFGKKPSELNAGELTMLAGIPNSPNQFDPLNDFAASRKRQAEVVHNMVNVGYLTEQEAERVLKEPIRLTKTSK
jgi:monofunctional glycosyltransferase